jgi:threonine dehydrogenase-like Zn-dependent dehydrogenase
MQAIVLTKSGVEFDRFHREPTPREGEVLVRVLHAGICETDLQLVRGYMDFQGILGHEFVGIAETGRFAGQRVVGEINCACHNCETCRAGLPTHCPHRTVLGILNHDGAFADYIAVPEANLHAIPDSVDSTAAVFVEPLAAAFQIPAQLKLIGNENVVVLGDGRLGNLCAQVLALSGCRVLAVGKHPRKLALLERRGIQTQLLENLFVEHWADIVVDCTGSPTGLPTALRFVRPRGTIVLKTTVAGEQTLALAPIVINEITVVGSRCGPFAPAIDALAAGTVDVQPLIDKIAPLRDGPRLLEEARTTPAMKILLQPG